MKTSRKLLFSLIFMAFGPAAASGVEVYAYVGGDAIVSCSYPAGYELYDKYFCTEACGNADVKVTTKQGTMNRFSTSDNRQMQIFSVNISNVQQSDAGKYWCGVSKSGIDIYTAVSLAVKSDECCDNVQSIQAYERSSVSIRCPHQNQSINSFKYLCKGSQPSTCRTQALVTTRRAQNGQFLLREDEFTLELSHVTKQNAGSYMCGIERSNYFDVFSRINLTVKETPKATTGSHSKTTADRPTTGSHSSLKDADALIAPAVLYALLGSLLIVVVMIAVIVHKRHRTQSNRVENKVRCDKEEVGISEVCCNQEPSAASEADKMYENYINEHIYGNC